MPDINIIKVEGKPIEKLIDVISNAIGTHYRPKAIRKEADSRAYEIEIIERARAKAKAESNEIEADSYVRINERFLFKELKRQQNIDNVSQIAAQQLYNEEIVSDAPVDNDWTSRFFNIIEDISDNEMQQLWGRILAGEVRRPNSYSLRSLELLKNLTKNEADVFVKFVQAKIGCGDDGFVYNKNSGKYLEEKFGITITDRLLLTELGLLSTNDDLVFSLDSLNQDDETVIFKYGTKGLFFYRGSDVPAQTIEILKFTKTGEELSRLISQDSKTDYIEEICSVFIHPNVRIEYGDLVEEPNGNILIQNKVEFLQK